MGIHVSKFGFDIELEWWEVLRMDPYILCMLMYLLRRKNTDSIPSDTMTEWGENAAPIPI